MPARRNKIVLIKGPKHKNWDYDQGKSIGEGGFGEVFKCRNKRTREDMAVKIVDHKSHGMTPKQVEEEVEYMSKAVHPHIVKFLCARLVDKKLQIFMELHTGSLEALINEHAGSASLRSLADAVAVQILFALQHLHTVHGIYHRDIKPGNILYTEVNGQYVFRLSDFGLSKFSTRPSNSNIGTEFFKAPEVGTSDNQTDRMDIYSLYMTLVYILDVDKCRTRAFEFRGKRHLVLETARNGATEVLKQYKEMSKINPSARASATDMLFKLLPTVYMTSKPEEETAAPDAAPGLQVHGDNDDPAAMEGTPHPRKRRRVENTGKETVTKARTDDHTEAHKTPISTTEPEHRERVKSSNMNENSPGRSLSIQRPLSLRPSRRGKMTEQDN